MFLLRHTANDKDFLTTTVSYKLDLRGPSVNVQTACSTSLVAVHLAVAEPARRSSATWRSPAASRSRCPTASATCTTRARSSRPTACCRAFDERSAGTVLTSGAGVVALRRLADALDDGDPILAVVKGTAINNDGQRKVGYLAPSVDGHADVVKEALAVAGLSGRDIQLLEAHGTGTAVGDPIEVAALTEAFRASTRRPGLLPAGVDEAEHRPPRHGRRRGQPDQGRPGAAPPHAAAAGQPHRAEPAARPRAHAVRHLHRRRTPWPGDRPRRAGISSLGVGGTNAHVIVEEAPALPPTPPAAPEQVLALSGRDDEAVAAGRRAASPTFLEANPDTNLADVAHTLATGRRAMTRRRRVVAATDIAARRRRAPLERPQPRRHVDAGDDHAPRGVHVPRRRLAVQRHGRRPRRPLRRVPRGDGATASSGSVKRRRASTSPRCCAPDAAGGRAARHHGVAAGGVPDVGRARPAVDGVGRRRPTRSSATASASTSPPTWPACSRSTARSTWSSPAAALMDRASGAAARCSPCRCRSRTVRPLLAETLSVATINADRRVRRRRPGRRRSHALQERVTTDEVTPTLIPLAAAGAQLAARPDPARVPRGRPRRRAVAAAVALPVEPHRHVDHRRAGHRPAVLGRPPAPHRALRRLPAHGAGRRARPCCRARPRPLAVVVRPPPGPSSRSPRSPALRHPNQEMDDTAFSLLAFGKAWAAGVDVDLDQFTGDRPAPRPAARLPVPRERHWIEPGTGAPISTGAVAAGAPVAARRSPRRPRRPPAWRRRASPTSPTRSGRRRGSSARRTPPRPPRRSGRGWSSARPTDPLVSAIAHELGARGVRRRGHAVAAPGLAGRRPVGRARRPDRRLRRRRRTLADHRIGGGAGARRGRRRARRCSPRSRGRRPTPRGTAAHPADAMAIGIVGTAPHEYPDVRTVLVDLDPSGNRVGRRRGRRRRAVRRRRPRRWRTAAGVG